MLCFCKFVQCKTSFTILVHFAYSDSEGKQKVSGPNLLSIESHHFLKLRSYLSNFKTSFNRQNFAGEEYIAFSNWTSLLWRNVSTYSSPLPRHWFRVSGKAGMLSHLLTTLVSYFLLNWLHERKNRCWNSEPSLCKLIHFHCYIWSTVEHLSKRAAADFQIVRCMYLTWIRVGVDPAVKLHNRKPQSLPEEGNYSNIPSTK